MLAAYYSKGSNSKEMFSSLKIGSSLDYENYLNKYDVIHFDVQECIIPAGGSENVLSYINKNVIEELRGYYPDVVTNDVKTLAEAFSLINNISGNKFVVIIDEWDVLIRDDANNQKVQEEYITFLRSIFKGVQASKYIALAYITGILPIKKEKTQSALNNFKEYTMLHPGAMSEYIGFTEEEVEKLCSDYSFNLKEIKRWYDGYILKGHHVYNPMAVVNSIIDGECTSYWTNTSSYKVIVPLINMNYDGLKTAIIETIGGGEVPVDTTDFQNDVVSFASKDDVLTYLIHLGYLAYNEQKKTAFIPNEEIRLEMNNAVKKRNWSERVAILKESQYIFNATLDMDGQKVADGIEKIHERYASSIKYNDENSLSSVLTIAYLSSIDFYYNPIREFPTGIGFTDFVYIPRKEYAGRFPLLIVELKWNKDAKSALNQIKEKKYPESIKEYTDNILLVGISYDKKTKKHECVIEKL